MRSALAEKRPRAQRLNNSTRFLAAKIYTLNYSGIFQSSRNAAIRLRSNSRAACAFRYLLPTVFLTQRLRGAKSSMSSPACVTIASLPMPVACLPATASAT
jgi:hypothetical protein